MYNEIAFCTKEKADTKDKTSESHNGVFVSLSEC